MRFHRLLPFAIVTASSELPDAPATNVTRLQPTDIWRSNEAGFSPVLTIDRGSATEPFDSFAVLFTTLQVGSDWIAIGAPTEADLDIPANRDFEVGEFPFPDFQGSQSTPRRHLYWHFDEMKNSRWVRFVFGIGWTGANISVGRVLFAQSWEPNVPFGLARGYLPNVIETPTDSGQTIINRHESRPRITFRARASTMEAFAALTLEVQRLAGEALVSYSPTGVHRHVRHYYGILNAEEVVEEDSNFFVQFVEIKGLL